MRHLPYHAARRPAARAFTLVELLVALTIFVILATLTLASFRGVSKNDHISAATNQIKGWFEHAKSKAIHDKLPRGVRFLRNDAGSPDLCTSVVYIGSAGYDDGDLVNTPRKYVTLSANRLQLLANATNGATQTATEWHYLRSTGALSRAAAQTHGLRVEVPRGSGFWYPIVDLSTSLTSATMTLGRPVTNYAAGNTSEPIDYRVELGPTVMQDNPISLPRGIVIDLDASILPSSWRTNYNFTTSSWVVPEQLDVMFNAQGQFQGQIATQIGVLHLLVSTQEDADAARLAAGGNHPETPPTPSAPPDRAVGSAFTYPFVLANPKTTQKVVSVFTSSGRISVSDVLIYQLSGSGQPVTFDSYANGTVNSLRLDTSPAGPGPLTPFRNALRGKEGK